MTEIINKYHNSKIYKLVSLQTEKYYIGSTTKSLINRFSHHRYDYKKHLEGSKNYLTSFEILKYDDCKIELIKLFKCENRKELETEEGILIKQYHDNILNIRIPNRTIKEWCNDNKEKIKDKHNKYYNVNKNHLLELSKKNKEINKDILHKKINCDCGGNYTINHKSTHFKTKKHLDFIMN